MVRDRVLGPALVALSVVGAPAAAHALTLTWEAPAGCPGRDAIIARLRAVSDPSRPLDARGVVTHDPAGEHWTLRLETDDGDVSGERELSASTCEELADAAVLVLSLALDAPGTESVEPPRPTPPVATRVIRRRERTRGGVRVAGALVVGPLPDASPAATMAVWVGRGRWRAEVLGAWMPSQTIALGGGVSATLGASSVGLRGCYALVRTRLELRACAGVEFGLMQGHGAGVVRPASGSSSWVSALVGVALAWPATRWLALTATLDGAPMLDRPTFVIDGVGEVHTPSRVGLAASLGAELSW